ncbi:hypothetical protein M758_UG139800 [Ceratodon purpureus]|nr:hypothetical protein M758_UG139800 [Ceratodon purpureus]
MAFLVFLKISWLIGPCKSMRLGLRLRLGFNPLPVGCGFLSGDLLVTVREGFHFLLRNKLGMGWCLFS